MDVSTCRIVPHRADTRLVTAVQRNHHVAIESDAILALEAQLGDSAGPRASRHKLKLGASMRGQPKRDSVAEQHGLNDDEVLVHQAGVGSVQLSAR